MSRPTDAIHDNSAANQRGKLLKHLQSVGSGTTIFYRHSLVYRFINIFTLRQNCFLQTFANDVQPMMR